MIKNIGENKTNINSLFIAANSSIIGSVSIGKNSSIWYGAVLRGDWDKIEIGEFTNIQDNAVIHVDYNYPCTIGNYVTIGHGAILHGCNVEDSCLIGIGAIILNGARIGKNSLVGAASLVTEEKKFPEASLILGSPARFVRKLSNEEVEKIKNNALSYVDMAQKHFI